MTLPSQIEVQSGGNACLTAGLWLVWLGAVSAILAHAHRMPVMLLIAGTVLLLGSIPRTFSASLQRRQLHLQANGSVSYGEMHGKWHSNTWRCSRFTVIPIRTDKTHWWAWISARNNLPENYRRLGIWCRYSPQPNDRWNKNGQLP
jgi:hypothetical protein